MKEQLRQNYAKQVLRSSENPIMRDANKITEESNY